jgi:hypothetical protein
MAKKGNDGFHLKFTIGKKLWTELFSVGLPFKVGEGPFDLVHNLRDGVRQLGVREKVKGLLEDRQVPAVITRGEKAARNIWHSRRDQVYKLMDDLVRVQGDWRVEVDKEGSDFHYATQRFGIEAHLKAVATGKVYLFRENIEFPFVLEKRIGAQAALVDIRYDKEKRALVGDLGDVAVDLGDNFILELLSRGVEYGITQQVSKVSPVSILKKEQVEELVGPAGGPLKLKLSVEDVEIEVDDDELTLKVRFGFSQLQLEGA